MFASLIARTSRTTYRGARGSGAGRSDKTAFRSSPDSRATLGAAVARGQVFKRSQRGLFDGSLLQTGNSIPKSVHKTLRTWRPNVQQKWIKSDLLDKSIRVKVTTRAMRTIEKYGGLDGYLQRRSAKLLGQFGRNLRSQMAALVRSRQGIDDVPT